MSIEQDHTNSEPWKALDSEMLLRGEFVQALHVAPLWIIFYLSSRNEL
jgi:hypothetical protein